jgi:hypothetical protein
MRWLGWAGIDACVHVINENEKDLVAPWSFEPPSPVVATGPSLGIVVFVSTQLASSSWSSSVEVTAELRRFFGSRSCIWDSSCQILPSEASYRPRWYLQWQRLYL